MLFTHPEYSHMPSSPMLIGEHGNKDYIGITQAQVLFLENKMGITGILRRKPGHILSLQEEFLEYNQPKEAHIFAFIYAANSKFLQLNNGPQMFLRSLALEVN
jgi:hypothetical protein